MTDPRHGAGHRARGPSSEGGRGAPRAGGARGDERAPDGAASTGLARLRAGAALFDAGRHHASHEVFERAWLAARAAGRRAEAHWWQGLVLCAGALHHRSAGNRVGARALSERAGARLARALADAPDDVWWRGPCEHWAQTWRRAEPATRAEDGPVPRLDALLDSAE